jgi:hypothetical protein
MFNKSIKVFCCACALLMMGNKSFLIAAEPEEFDQEMVTVLKATAVEEFDRTYHQADMLSKKLGFSDDATIRQQLNESRRGFDRYSGKVSVGASQQTIKAHLEYMRSLIEKVQELYRGLMNQEKERAKRQLCVPMHPVQPTATVTVPSVPVRQDSLATAILKHFGKTLESIPFDRSVDLVGKDKVHTVAPEAKGSALENLFAKARRFPGGVVIEIKSSSQKGGMACGLYAYAFARIFQSAANFEQLNSRLTNGTLIDDYVEHDLPQKMGIEDCGVWDYLKTQGLPFWLSDLTKALDKTNICRLAHDVKTDSKYKEFRTKPKIGDFLARIPANCIFLTGQDIDKIGHWLGVRIERMPDGRLAIIFADGCPFLRNHLQQIIGAKDGIEDFKEIFDDWFQHLSPEKFSEDLSLLR